MLLQTSQRAQFISAGPRCRTVTLPSKAAPAHAAHFYAVYECIEDALSTAGNLILATILLHRAANLQSL